MLERHGYRVITAGDGTLALTELSRHLGEVRLVITDILMPFMDGVQLIHALRHMAPELRVIASSGALGMPGQKDRTDEVKALGSGKSSTSPTPSSSSCAPCMMSCSRMRRFDSPAGRTAAGAAR